ncbi:MAG: hypothetical protein QW718_00510 [Nitrososphaerota archaeon]
MKDKEKISLFLAMFILSLFILSSILEVSAISHPKYLTNLEITPTYMTVAGDRVIVYDPAGGNLLFISKEGRLVRSLQAPKNIMDITSSGDKIFLISSADTVLYVYGVQGEYVKEIELPGPPNDFDVSSRFLSVSLPDNDLIIVFDVASLNESSRIWVDVDHGISKISVDNNFVYAVRSDGFTLVRIDLERDRIDYLKLDEKIVALKASNSRVLVATSDDTLYMVAEDFKIKKKWSLEKASTIDIGLHMLSDGRIVYVARSRWVIGEIEEDNVNEVRTEGRIFSDVLDVDRVWFTEVNTRRIGWVWLSRPPIVQSITVEPQGGGSFTVSAKIIDPDKEDIKALLIVTIKSKIPYLPGDNKTYDMEYLLDRNLYVSGFQLKAGDEAEVYVVAIDPVNNIGTSQRIPIKYVEEETKTVTLVSPTTASPRPIELTDLYMVASSLLLLIPIIAALLIMKTKRKPKKKTRK